MRGATWESADAYRADTTARRFENWEFSWALVLGAGASAQYAIDRDMTKIESRVKQLANKLRQLIAEIEPLSVLDRGEELAGIVSIACGDIKPEQLVTGLRAQRINTSAQIRAYAVIDYDRKGVKGSLRISPHYYNTDEELAQCTEALRQLTSLV